MKMKERPQTSKEIFAFAHGEWAGNLLLIIGQIAVDDTFPQNVNVIENSGATARFLFFFFFLMVIQ